MTGVDLYAWLAATLAWRRPPRRPRMKVLTRSLVALILVLTCASLQGRGVAQGGDGRTQRTAQYRITLDIGPLPAMLRPVSVPGIPLAKTTMTDQGRPVNRHLAVAVYDTVTGARLWSPRPRITIADRSTGRPRDLQAILAMSEVTEGQGDVYFGGNVHLANGTYRITVSVGDERAVFKKVAVGRP
jgi:hypothetical protein